MLLTLLAKVGDSKGPENPGREFAALGLVACGLGGGASGSLQSVVHDGNGKAYVSARWAWHIKKATKKHRKTMPNGVN